MRSWFWAPAGVALLFGGLGFALSVRPLSLTDLCSGADEIVYARVDAVESHWVGQRIETSVTLTTFETWKGRHRDAMVVTVPGGTVGSITMKSSDAPTFRAGQNVICFLRTRDEKREVYGWFRGQYTVVGDRVREMQDMPLATLRGEVEALVRRGEKK